MLTTAFHGGRLCFLLQSRSKHRASELGQSLAGALGPELGPDRPRAGRSGEEVSAQDQAGAQPLCAVSSPPCSCHLLTVTQCVSVASKSEERRSNSLAST